MISPDEIKMLERLKVAVQENLRELARKHTSFKLKWAITVDDNSPWIIIEVTASEAHDVVLELPREFAMWRASRDIYKVVNAAVLEDPVLTEALMEHGPVLAHD